MENQFSGISSHWDDIRPLLLLASVIALVIIINYQPDWAGLLRYERSTFTEQLWQGLSHALIHVNLQHMSLNILALICLFTLFPEAFRSYLWLLVLAFSAIASSAGLYFYSPDIDWCVGLSGALHGLIVYSVLRTNAGLFWLLAIVAKIIIEQSQIFSDAEWVLTTAYYIQHPVVIDAHLWGAIGGLVFYIIVQTFRNIPVLMEINARKE